MKSPTKSTPRSGRWMNMASRVSPPVHGNQLDARSAECLLRGAIDGCVRLKRSHAIEVEPLAEEMFGDGLWRVDNPFGPKVLPMCSVGINCHPCDRNRPEEIGSSGWIRTSNPPVNSGVSVELLRVAGSCCLLLLVA
jgi:hypothetical protein